MTTPLEESLKARIRNLASERRIAPDELWVNLVLERFLVRLSRSPYANQFVFKGGALLSRIVDLGRHTQDLDFYVQNLSNTPIKMEDTLKEIIAERMDDGFTFTDLIVKPLPHPHMKYAGVRANMRALFGKIRTKVEIDMGFSDLVRPVSRKLPLLSGSKGSLFEGYVEISCYPKEFILAEKLEAAVFLGGSNTRLKDYHDLYVMSRNAPEQGLETVIRSVFAHRQTPLKLPIKFSDDQLSQFQTRWKRHLAILPDNHAMPYHFDEVVTEINSWLTKYTSF